MFDAVCEYDVLCDWLGGCNTFCIKAMCVVFLGKDIMVWGDMVIVFACKSMFCLSFIV